MAHELSNESRVGDTSRNGSTASVSLTVRGDSKTRRTGDLERHSDEAFKGRFKLGVRGGPAVQCAWDFCLLNLLFCVCATCYSMYLGFLFVQPCCSFFNFL